MLNYLSICSGIEAASVAWRPLGWRAAGFAEIDRFPSCVLAHHYPEVMNHGDFTKIQAEDTGRIDILVGGTPCQSFSVAGLRGGMADDRGNLALEYLRLADRTCPEWLVWENVPGVLSSGEGRDFGSFLGGMAELGYGWAYRIIDAQFFGVAQRRRRVFVVGYLGDWRRAAAVLFERQSLSGDPAPSREAGEGVTGTITSGPGGRGPGPEEAASGQLIARTITTREGRHHDDSCETLVAQTLRGEGFDASEDGTGRWTPLVPIAFDTTQITSTENRCNPQAGDPCHPLAAGAHPPAVVFQSKASPSNSLNPGPIAPTLDVGKSDGLCVYQCHGTNVGEMGTLRSGNGHLTGGVPFTPTGGAVRRLTPRECERLQGFPDDYTMVPTPRGMAADGPRYKALGNSMAVPVMRWIGERINGVILAGGAGQ